MKLLFTQNSEDRVLHSLGVVIVGLELAYIWGAEFAKVYIAGLIHDIGRDLPANKLKQDLTLSPALVSPDDWNFPQLLHCNYAADILHRKLKILDIELQNAIGWHSTGEAGMSTLQKIIFLADYIEPTRDFAGVEELRKLAYVDLDEAVARAIKMKFDYLRANNLEIHPRLLRAYKYYVKDKV